MLLNNESVYNEMKENNERYLKTNEKENTTTQSLWDTAKLVIKWKFIVFQAYLKKQGKSLMDNLVLYLKKLEKG